MISARLDAFMLAVHVTLDTCTVIVDERINLLLPRFQPSPGPLILRIPRLINWWLPIYFILNNDLMARIVHHVWELPRRGCPDTNQESNRRFALHKSSKNCMPHYSVMTVIGVRLGHSPRRDPPCALHASHDLDCKHLLELSV